MNWKKYLPFIGILIFIYILLKLDISQIIKEISNAKLIFLLIALFFVFLYFITETLKWFIIARIQKINIPFIQAFKINLMGTLYSFITPSKIGGSIRAEYLRKYNNQKIGKGLSNYVLDKVLDLCSLVFLAIIFSFVFKKLIPINFFYISILTLIILAGCLIYFRDEKRSKKILKIIIYKKLIPKKIKSKAKESFYYFYKDMPKKRYFILFFFINLINWFVLYTISFFIAISLEIYLPFFYFLAILPIATLAGQIPITISGLGTREAVLISLFGLFGISATKVFSMSMIGFFVLGVLHSLIGSILAIKHRIK